MNKIYLFLKLVNVCIFFQGTVEIGGIGKTWEIASEKGRLNVFK